MLSSIGQRFTLVQAALALWDLLGRTVDRRLFRLEPLFSLLEFIEELLLDFAQFSPHAHRVLQRFCSRRFIAIAPAAPLIVGALRPVRALCRKSLLDLDGGTLLCLALLLNVRLALSPFSPFAQ